VLTQSREDAENWAPDALFRETSRRNGLKGRNMPALGNAQGQRTPSNNHRPVGAQQVLRSRASGFIVSFVSRRIIKSNNSIVSAPTFCYDAGNELTSQVVDSTTGGSTTAFAYDDWGRMVTKRRTTDSRQATHEYPDGSRPTRYTDTDTTRHRSRNGPNATRWGWWMGRIWLDMYKRILAPREITVGSLVTRATPIGLRAIIVTESQEDVMMIGVRRTDIEESLEDACTGAADPGESVPEASVCLFQSKNEYKHCLEGCT